MESRPDDFDVASISSVTTEDYVPSSDDAKATMPLLGKNTKEELPPVGMICDAKNLWEAERKRGRIIWSEEYPENVKPNPEETEAVQRYALIIRNTRNDAMDGKAMIVSTIVVQSPLLKPLLEEVFEGYDGITATLKKVTFARPFAPFFYRWAQFKKAVEEVQDEETHAHTQLLYKVLSEELDETITTYQDLLSHGVMTYKNLWTLFQPGDLILCNMGSHDMIMRLQSSGLEPGGFGLNCKYVSWSGYSFGYATYDFMIYPYSGTKAITDLGPYPIRFNSDSVAIEEKLAERGRRFAKLQGYHYKMYKGIAELQPVVFADRYVPVLSRTLEGRIIIHAEMYNRYNPSENFPLDPLESTSFAPRLSVEMVDHRNMPPPPPPPPMPMPPPPPPPGQSPFMMHPAPGIMPGTRMPMLPPPPPTQEPQILPDDLYSLCTPVVKGYSLKTKNWAKFDVNNIDDIVWEDHAFDNLVLPPGYKDLILSFTKSQQTVDVMLDDVIEGKGQGIVMLLNGQSGVGKTLTAEAVAEHMRVPLYSMSAAQLGVDSSQVERALGDILEMTTRWKAILLLDECEVFLEQRTIDSLERNKLVSIFLRMLEYHRGCIFMTCNRVSALDKAIESRIHLKIAYPALDQTARLRIWNNLLELLPASAVGLDPSDLYYLAQKRMNGREIKNVIKAAQLLAKEQDTALNLDHVHTVLRITQIGEDFGAQA
ncbi:P-loop containing nucleoside triphosphate hydrolase protein [Massariosphaeria phaeospora]|uniref:P-loop containing nucleoside triphosphate hydrolase protein n=1 Tax=Massariosphaeria phaeospora TaxID=100035 RepID=A0A7C8IA63_9PLEO|nr:P-loop containing nucleoside triphosphate hydrolase protein [Massariosphaeria phaeospora]